MKPILDLTKAIGKEDYFFNQFYKRGEEKNILFVNPQLSGKHLYKMILPFFSMYNEKVATAISGLSKYDYESQIYGNDDMFFEKSGKFKLSEEMIDWANFIVFPFTSQPLVLFYDYIRSVNQDVQIVFLVDFNFYELSDLHPFRDVFKDEKALSDTEDNIWYSDVCLTSNAELVQELMTRFTDLSQTKYSGVPSNLRLACMPYMIDTEIVLKNISDFDPLKPILVNNEHTKEVKSHINEVAKAAEEVKEADLAEKEKKKDEEEQQSDTVIEETTEIISENTNEISEQNDNSEDKKELKSNVKENGNSKQQPTKSKSTKPKSTRTRSTKKSKSSSKPKATTKRGKSTKKR